MIQYFFENVEEITLPENCSEWVEKLISNEEKKVGNINYIFCDDIRIIIMIKKILIYF